MRTDASDDWAPRTFAEGELEALVAERRADDPASGTLAQLATCAESYGCFTAQNVFLRRGEAALPVSPRCNARCVGCISEQDDGVGFPAPQLRIVEETDPEDLARVALAHLACVPEDLQAHAGTVTTTEMDKRIDCQFELSLVEAVAAIANEACWFLATSASRYVSCL